MPSTVGQLVRAVVKRTSSTPLLIQTGAGKVTGPLEYTPYRQTAAQAAEAAEFCRKQREALEKFTERSRPLPA